MASWVAFICSRISGLIVLPSPRLAIRPPRSGSGLSPSWAKAGPAAKAARAIISRVFFMVVSGGCCF